MLTARLVIDSAQPLLLTFSQQPEACWGNQENPAGQDLLETDPSPQTRQRSRHDVTKLPCGTSLPQVTFANQFPGPSSRPPISELFQNPTAESSPGRTDRSEASPGTERHSSTRWKKPEARAGSIETGIRTVPPGVTSGIKPESNQLDRGASNRSEVRTRSRRSRAETA